MPDISMCQNKQCPSRMKCYRFTAMPNQWRQAYMDFRVDAGKSCCEDFIDATLKPQGGEPCAIASLSSSPD